MTGWRKDPALQEWAFKAAYPNDRTANRDEQDDAAASQGRTLMRDDGSKGKASIRFRQRHRSSRTYAWLRWTAGRRGKDEIFVCEVTGESRSANLRHAWSVVHDRNLLTPEGRARHKRTKE